MLSRRTSLTAVAIGIAIVQSVLPVSALAGIKHGRAPQWRVEVNQIDAGASHIAPEFKVAIYENLVVELTKAKQFSAVLRGGDSGANGVPNLLILKTTVESYTPGSETKRAVTTLTGATKLKVRSQLCTRDGQVVLERVVDGNVRFFGGNLRATHNLARNVVKAIKQGSLPEPAPSDPSAVTIGSSAAMKILVLNSGSSSQKACIFEMEGSPPVHPPSLPMGGKDRVERRYRRDVSQKRKR